MKSIHSPYRVGYAWWGFMADVRMKGGDIFSSPDGSLLHAFTIINGLAKMKVDGKQVEVHRLYPDRDVDYIQKLYSHGVPVHGAFAAFSQYDRTLAYTTIHQCMHRFDNPSDPELHWPDLDLVLIEWRMPTDRNTLDPSDPHYDPDLFLQTQLIQHYTAKGTPIICLDLDYKMDPSVDDSQFYHVFELGWKRGLSNHIDIPFDFDMLIQFPHLAPKHTITYIGNRYERDEMFTRFFGRGDEEISYHVHGNWLEKGRDSKERWPHVHFHPRCQPSQFRQIYKDTLATPLLAKEEYAKHGFMTIRLIETLLFGSMPLFPIDFHSPIDYTAGLPLFVNNEAEMLYASLQLTSIEERERMRLRMVEHLRQYMDISVFLRTLFNIL